jgi:hypothetical protein
MPDLGNSPGGPVDFIQRGGTTSVWNGLREGRDRVEQLEETASDGIAGRGRHERLPQGFDAGLGSRFIDDLPREPVANDAELEAIVTKANATDGKGER